MAQGVSLFDADDPCVLEPTMRANRRRAAAGFDHHGLPGVGHFPHQERPDEVNALVGKFLSER